MLENAAGERKDLEKPFLAAILNLPKSFLHEKAENK
jgi:hypothetical protein